MSDNRVIRCKVRCDSVTKFVSWRNRSEFLYTAKFSAVCDDTEENKRFWEFTPSGTIEFATIKVDDFEPGKEYYVDFTLAAAPAPAN